MQDQPIEVLVTGIPEEDGHAARLRGLVPRARIAWCADAAALRAQAPRAEVIAGHVPDDVLARAPRLKWVHSWAAGPNRQLYPDFVARGPILTSSKGNGAVPLAEHALMLMLMLNRDAMRWVAGQLAGRWDPFRHGELHGRRVGILGAGHAGQALAHRCRAFGMSVSGLSRSGRPRDGFDEMHAPAGLHEVLSGSDFVVVTAPLTDETRGMLGPREFAAMKPSAFYICISRGGIAQDDALLEALRTGRIAGAGLDAHAQEPLPPGSPFWTLRNVVITPHNGATTAGTAARGFDIFARNLVRYGAGQPLENVVDPGGGY